MNNTHNYDMMQVCLHGCFVRLKLWHWAWPTNFKKIILFHTCHCAIFLNYISSSSSSSSAFPSYISGVHHFGWAFADVTIFFNPTIEVVTFRHHGCCMLTVFLLPAFTCLGHECQDLLSLCDRMHACTDKTFVYNLIRNSFWGMESEPMLTQTENSPLLEKSS